MSALAWSKGPFNNVVASQRTLGSTGANIMRLWVVKVTEKTDDDDAKIEFDRLLVACHKEKETSTTLQAINGKGIPPMLSELLLVASQAWLDGNSQRGRVLASTVIASAAMVELQGAVKQLAASKALVCVMITPTTSRPATFYSPEVVTSYARDKETKVVTSSIELPKDEKERFSSWIIPMSHLFATSKALAGACIIAQTHSPIDVPSTKATEDATPITLDMTGLL